MSARLALVHWWHWSASKLSNRGERRLARARIIGVQNQKQISRGELSLRTGPVPQCRQCQNPIFPSLRCGAFLLINGWFRRHAPTRFCRRCAPLLCSTNGIMRVTS